MTSIRPPAVSGLFYPTDAATLSRNVRAFLAAAHASAPPPKALIVPHAGYVYSGAIAASGYATLQEIAPRIRRVVLLGPTHRVAVRGLALPGADAFTTPLGTVQVDKEAALIIAHLPFVTLSPQAHAQEHSLEVQLPFLQTVLPDFKVLPLAVGMASAEEVAQVLELLWGGDETLIVISSDLSHYLPYDTARSKDSATAAAILDLAQGISHEQACGATPINGLLLAARRHHLSPHLLDLRNSGDTAGPRDGVVGYAAFAFNASAPSDAEAAPAHEEVGRTLLALARGAIAERFGARPAAVPAAAWLNRQGATFVTLTQQGQLRGCIGSLQAHRPLLEDIRQNAVAAAFHDPRFVPLSAAELGATKVEVSLLSPAEAMRYTDEADALRQLRPNVDGVIFQYGQYRSTFLPQVWEQLPQPGEFMAHLKHKAGLQPNFWSPEVSLLRYTVEKWKE
jgi:AmmeMemoRadiSam system protein B/AmmeMemoRadiSam system protein A